MIYTYSTNVNKQKVHTLLHRLALYVVQSKCLIKLGFKWFYTSFRIISQRHVTGYLQEMKPDDSDDGLEMK